MIWRLGSYMFPWNTSFSAAGFPHCQQDCFRLRLATCPGSRWCLNSAGAKQQKLGISVAKCWVLTHFQWGMEMNKNGNQSTTGNFTKKNGRWDQMTTSGMSQGICSALPWGSLSAAGTMGEVFRYQPFLGHEQQSFCFTIAKAWLSQGTIYRPLTGHWQLSCLSTCAASDLYLSLVVFDRPTAQGTIFGGTTCQSASATGQSWGTCSSELHEIFALFPLKEVRDCQPRSTVFSNRIRVSSAPTICN